MKRRLILFGLILFVLAGIDPAVSQTQSQRSNWVVRVPSRSLKNLYRVSDDLYRSEQPDHAAFTELKALGVKSVLNLRTTEKDDKLIGDLGIKPFIVPMDAGNFTDKEIIDALKVIASAPKPILVHCRHGSDRTGVVVAMYRIIFQNWDKEDALNELLNGDYGFHPCYKNIPEYIRTVNIESIRTKIKE